MTTWNPDDIGSAVALSNGNLTATKTDSAISRSGRATTSKTTGKKYFEGTVGGMSVDLNLAAVAVAENTADLSTYFGRFTDSIAYYGDGSVYQNDVVLATLAAYTAGSTVGLAVDEDAGKGWFCDGSGSYGAGDPSAGTGEHFTFTAGIAFFPGFTVNDNSPADIVTANFGATAFVHDVPAGFEAWDAALSVAVASPALSYGAGRAPKQVSYYERLVTAKWEEIERIEARIAAKEAEEREKARQLEEAQCKLAELEQARATEAKRRKLQADIRNYRGQITALQFTIYQLTQRLAAGR